MRRLWAFCCVLLCLMCAGCRDISAPPAWGDESMDFTYPSSALLPGPSGEGAGVAAKELRGVWVTALNLSLRGLGPEDARGRIDEMMERVAAMGFNTVFLQMRPYADALYPSKIFPWSHMVTGTQGQDPGYDPLALALEAAHKRNLSLHAWLNPYRIQYLKEAGNTPPALTEAGPVAGWQNDGLVLTLPSGLYLNPAVPAVRDLIVRGAVEIVQNYAVDGIHFDDYFYPEDMGDADAAAFEAYQADGGALQLADWRRDQVSGMVRAVRDAVKGVRADCIFGVSPLADTQKNREAIYADVTRWGSEAGFVDYLCPQIYFGYENSTLPFTPTLEAWCALVTSPDVRLYVGLAAYKAGVEDVFAGMGKAEWQQGGDILGRQVLDIRGQEKCGGFIFYNYQALFEQEWGDVQKREIQTLKDLLTAE